MKNVVYLSLIVAFFAAACSSNKNGFITKRKYTKGYFVDMKSRNKHQVKEHQTAVAIKKHEARHTVNVLEPVAPAVEVNAAVVTAAASNHFSKTQVNSVKPVSAAVNAEKTNLMLKSEVKPSVKELFQARKAVKSVAKASAKDGDSDLNLIVMIILCLFPFINLIPVYLHDGKALTMNFWVTLILDLLFFFPGIIFSLLVVLDIVNLA